jgi:hypothetical protein
MIFLIVTGGARYYFKSTNPKGKLFEYNKLFKTKIVKDQA